MTTNQTKENMASEELSREVVLKVIPLLKGYTDDSVCEEEYLRSKLDFTNDSTITRRSAAELFFGVIRYQKFLKHLIHVINEKQNRRKTHGETVITVMLYLLLFRLNAKTISSIRDLFHSKLKLCVRLLRILEFLCRDDIDTVLTKVASCHFDIDHIEGTIVKQGSDRHHLIQDLLQGVREYIHKKTSVKKIKPTVPQEMRVLTRMTEVTVSSLEPPNDSECVEIPQQIIRRREVPKSTYEPPVDFELIEEKRHENKERAQRLLKNAQESRQPTCPQKLKVKETEPCEKLQTRKIKHFKLVQSSPSEVKPTAATILREGARYLKEQENEIKKLETMIAGGYNIQKLEQMEKEVQREMERKVLEDLELKRLKCLMSAEEAKLAKKYLLIKMKEKHAEFQKEREKLEMDLEEWRRQERNKIKEQIEKCNEIKKNAKESKVALIKVKQKNAREVDETSKQYQYYILKQKEEEMEKKIQMIREIKALNRVRVMHSCELDVTWTPGIGLFCEMSLAELSERLALIKIHFQEELETRQNRVKAMKSEREVLLRDVENFIKEQRQIRKAKDVTDVSKPSIVPIIQTSEEIRKLRKKLEKKKKEILLLESKINNNNNISV